MIDAEWSTYVSLAHWEYCAVYKRGALPCDCGAAEELLSFELWARRDERRTLATELRERVLWGLFQGAQDNIHDDPAKGYGFCVGCGARQSAVAVVHDRDNCTALMLTGIIRDLEASR